MRVLMVSAHYPPNFVSGGTVQPARLAQALVELGHEVLVYAGWLGTERAPLAVHETVEEGVDVRWIATSTFLAWDDDRNWDGPEVTADFAQVLRRFDPDVVHVHGLQTLGVGVVREAVRHRARVVVTMHDFWWLCTRMFLVDRRWRPCSLVLDCGDCACELGASWATRRSTALRAVLAGVDAVLAPSAFAARVLRANGVDGVEVDENGLVEPVLAPRPDRRSDRSEGDRRGPVTFVYTGGDNPMKGGGVVLDVARGLARRVEAPWRLVTYGWSAAVGDLKGLPVETRPSFAPDALDDVLAEADVLLVPSLMRETHSLVTREALGRGVPVVCSDAGGPEEVVSHGHNGLVVASVDSDALTQGLVAALSGLVADPDRLAVIRAGAAAGVAVRSLHDQVAGLEERYRRLVSSVGVAASVGMTDDPPTRAVPPSKAGQVRQVCFVAGIEGAPLQYRVRHPAEALALVGVSSDLRWYRDPDLVERTLASDAVVFYRVPATVEVLDLIQRLGERGIPVLFDVDDLIFDPDLAEEIPALRLLPEAEADLWLQGVRRYRSTLEACDVFIGSTQALVDHAAAVVPGLVTARFDNGVGIEGARAADLALRRPRRPGALRLGYFSGTTTHDEDWMMVAPAVGEVMDRRPDVELWLGGHVPDVADLHRHRDRVHRQPMVPWLSMPGLLRDVDVNLAPLVAHNRFNEAKSAIKWMEAALVSTPTVATASGPFREVVTSGRTGVLVEGPDGWVPALENLLESEEIRQRIGAAARRDALLGWSPHLQGRRYQAILEDAWLHHRGAATTRVSPWVVEAPSEPSEPYRHDLVTPRLHVPAARRAERAREIGGARWGRCRRQIRGLWRRAGVLLAAEGPMGPVRGAGRVTLGRLRRAR